MNITRIICWVLVGSLLSGSAIAKPAGEKTNVVFILCDDLGYGDVQCLNPERGKIPTPNVDQLAAKG